MMVLKSQREIDKMRRSGAVVAQALQLAKAAVKPGVTTAELDEIIAGHFVKHGATPLFLGVPNFATGAPGFPAVSCISINEQLVHGVPGTRQLKRGDIVKLDTGCRLDNWCADSAITVPVGEISTKVQKLITVTQDALQLAIEMLAESKCWSEIAGKISKLVRSNGFGIVEAMSGHSIGRNLHEEPMVPNYISEELRRKDIVLEPGLVIAIEPMVSAGTIRLAIEQDGWTTRTMDHSLTAHAEHTVAITAQGPLVLTVP